MADPDDVAKSIGESLTAATLINYVKGKRLLSDLIVIFSFGLLIICIILVVSLYSNIYLGFGVSSILIAIIFLNKDRLFFGANDSEVSLLIDSKLQLKERVTAVLELENDQDSEVQKILQEQIASFSPPKEQWKSYFPLHIPRFIYPIWTLIVILLLVVLFKEQIIVSAGRNNTYIDIQKIEDVIENQELPTEVRKSFEDIKEALSEGNINDEEVKRAIENAKDEIQKAEDRLNSKNATDDQREIIPQKNTPTPTVTPTIVPEENKPENTEKNPDQDAEKNPSKDEAEKESKDESKKEGGKESQDSKDASQGKGVSENKEQGSDKGKDQDQPKDQDQNKEQGKGQGQDKNQDGGQDKGKEQGKDKGQGKDQGKEQGDGQNKQNGENKNSEQESKQSLSQASEAIKDLQKQGKEQGQKKQQGKEQSENEGEGGKSPSEQGDTGKSPDNKGDPKDKENKGANKGDSGEKKGEEKGDSEDKSDSDSENSASKSSLGKESEAREFIPGDKEGNSPYGNNKTLKDTKVGEQDEKLDTRYLGEEGELAKNKENAKSKYSTKDLNISKPEDQNQKHEQPIPLEYEDILR